MSKRLIAVNVALASLAVFFAAWLARDLAASRPLPGSAIPRKTAAAAASEEISQGNAAQDRLTAYDVIVAKYLFNPSRTEGRTEPTKPAVPLPPKPNLLGVVVDGSRSRAYLEDPSTKRVVAYQLGDSVAGGTLERIADDRVQIARSDGLMEVMLRDPSKPTPAPPTPRPTRGAAPVAPRGGPQPLTIPGRRVAGAGSAREHAEGRVYLFLSGASRVSDRREGRRALARGGLISQEPSFGSEINGQRSAPGALLRPPRYSRRRCRCRTRRRGWGRRRGSAGRAESPPRF